MKKLLMCFTLLSLSACSLIPKPDFNITQAQINKPSLIMQDIQKKAPPKVPIPVAVYSFRDKSAWGRGESSTDQQIANYFLFGRK